MVTASSLTLRTRDQAGGAGLLQQGGEGFGFGRGYALSETGEAVVVAVALVGAQRGRGSRPALRSDLA